jgi:geranylgeranyl reductase family protein
MKRYDVIVAGAGPAGSTTARECASRGLSVLLLDKAVFPRDKPCGGGVNLRAARLLPFDLGPVVERVIRGMYVSVCQSQGFLRYGDEPLSFLTQRRFLDSYLVARAQDAGAVLRERAAVRAIEPDGPCLVVRAGSEAFVTRTLVAADGANGPTGKLAGLTIQRWKAFALEANVTPAGGVPSQWRDVFAVDVGSVPGGYGWLFPKGDHVNVGVGGWPSIGPTLRRRLDTLTRFYGLEPAGFWGLRGHPLPVRRPGATLTQGPVLAVGDAAGLLDPLTGEGIYSAIWSGIVAARHLTALVDGRAPDLLGYQREVERVLLVELDAALQFRDVFHLAPGLWAGLVRRSPRVWRAVCSLIAGDQTYAGIKGRWSFLPLGVDVATDAIRAAARRMHRLGGEDTPPPDRFLRRWSQADAL